MINFALSIWWGLNMLRGVVEDFKVPAASMAISLAFSHFQQFAITRRIVKLFYYLPKTFLA